MHRLSIKLPLQVLYKGHSKPQKRNRPKKKVKVLHHHHIIEEVGMDKMMCKIKECNTLYTTWTLQFSKKQGFCKWQQGGVEKSRPTIFANTNETMTDIVHKPSIYGKNEYVTCIKKGKVLCVGRLICAIYIHFIMYLYSSESKWIHEVLKFSKPNATHTPWLYEWLILF